ncbi:dehydrogenase [Thalassotalea sp. HSM 43]|uniref:alcohol dehydrogenase catalytic domain-containing protein n=1 Tax=Thalassotalea sp. HSM 43 TaxID=2552945 RepID=UPI001080B517|nr:zinc-binding dehydrogenase [Thalassotalea sp. HSM 43]QBY05943.1 dehydrogenase [Thalassotalea sp. HSM 43]
MKAVTFDPHSDTFALSNIEIPKLQYETDVLLKTHACGLNPVDAKIHLWKAMVNDMSAQWVPGLDVVGEVVDVGSKVDKFKAGDMVLCHGNMLRAYGGFAEYCIQDSEVLLPLPAVDVAIAAATPCAGWTAWRALVDKLNVADRNSVLITGGAGGVGSFAVQLARYFQLDTIIATCLAKNAAFVSQLGATDVIDYQSDDVVARVKQITNQQGVDIGLDTVGADNDIIVANSLRFDGQMVEIVDVVRPDAYDNAFLMGLGFHQLSLGAGHGHGRLGKASIVFAGQQFSQLVEAGKIAVPSLASITIEQVPTALNDMLSQRTVGKIVMCL